MTSLTEALSWRYATKKFDTERRVSGEDLDALKTAVRLSASSFGLQPYRVAVVDEQSVQDRLLPHSYNQQQVADASHVFVFAAKLDVTPDYVDRFIELTAQVRAIPVDDVRGYGEYIKSNIANKDTTFIQDWNRRQAYIGLGTLLATAAELRVDACPMEGFDPAGYDEVLGLKEKGLTACVICPIGYRHPEDHAALYPKVRWPESEFYL